jgi:FkbM family methyltransferase
MADRSTGASAGEVATTEFRLGLLHEFIAALPPRSPALKRYIEAVRALRERVHPAGRRELRWIDTDRGLRLLLDLGDRLGADFYFGYLQEAAEHAVLMSLLPRGAVFVDVGANFGHYALSAAARVGPEGHVYALEPNASAAELLRENVRANGLGNVVCHEVCAGAEEGTAPFYETAEHSFSSLALTARSAVRRETVVRVRPLDGLLAEQGSPPVAAMKIDVEGVEFAVLRGARETFRRSPDLVTLMEVNQKNLDPGRREDLLSSVTELGLAAFTLDDRGGAINRVGSARELARLAAANVFLVRAGSAGEAGLQQSVEEGRAATGSVHQYLTRAGSGGPLQGDLFAYIDALLDDTSRALAESPPSGREASPPRLLRAQEELARLRERLREVEKESRARLDLVQQLTHVEDEGRARLELVRDTQARAVALESELRDTYRRLSALESELRDTYRRLSAVEADSQQRLQLLLHTQDALTNARRSLSARLRARATGLLAGMIAHADKKGGGADKA